MVWRSCCCCRWQPIADGPALKCNARPCSFFSFVNAGGIAGFTALTLIPLGEMTALSFTSPLFITIGAVLFLGEVIRARRIAALAVGMCGTLIILQPGITAVSAGPPAPY